MWSKSDIVENETYTVVLCQDDEARRYLQLRANGQPLPPFAYFETLPVPNEILQSRNFYRIAEAVRLTNGEPFEFDAHGIWLTQKEVGQFVAPDYIPTDWSTPVPPRFPSK